jgi:molecular chaperone DnaK
MPAFAATAVPVGIDLGTTFSVLAYLDESGRPTTVPNALGDKLTPSTVFVDEREILVGKEALQAAVLAPENFADCFKRDMGRHAYHRPVAGRQVPPEVLSALVLERLRLDAARRLGAPRQAVITVPAYFDELRRAATQEAGRLAGWEVLDIINEPTAAALSCGLEHGLFGPQPEARPERVLVYDLGGGTFDVTLLEVDGSTFRTLATDGDVGLGGRDFDERIVDWAASEFVATHGLDPRSNPRDAFQLWADAEEVKHLLSDRACATLVVRHADLRLRLELSRQQFEELTQDLLERTRDTAELLVRHAGTSWSQIDRVVAVGGATRMPMVRRMLRELSGKEPDQSVHPDEAVAQGAALYAGMVVGRTLGVARRQCVLINVNSHSLGIIGVDEKTGVRVNSILIPRNTPLPAARTKQCCTLEEGQRSVAVPVVEGESERPEFCLRLGKCVVSGLPQGLPKGTPVEVEYRYESNGRLSVSARLPAIGKQAQVVIEREQAAQGTTLAHWREQLLGGASAEDAAGLPFAASPASLDLNDPRSIRKRLDTLYVQVGRRALDLPVPPPVQPAQQAARQAAADYHQARRRVEQARARRDAAIGLAEAIERGSELSQAEMAARQAQAAAAYAYLVLGRECALHRAAPPDTAPLIAEIDDLRPRLQQG